MRVASGNIIATHWRGDFPLWVSYWVFGFMCQLLVAGIVFSIFNLTERAATYDPSMIFLSVAGIWILVGAINLWQVVGVWRSASKHTSRSGKGFWATAAKVMMVLGILRLLADFANVGQPQIVETWRMAFQNDPDIPDYRIQLTEQATSIRISGGIKFGLTRDLKSLLNAAPDVKRIELDSIGGRIGEANQLYDIIIAHNLDTHVSGECLSTCTIVYSAGGQRSIAYGARIGLHSPSFPGLSEIDLKTMREDWANRLLARGIDSGFIERGLSEPSSSMWFPTEAQLLSAGLITRGSGVTFVEACVESCSALADRDLCISGCRCVAQTLINTSRGHLFTAESVTADEQQSIDIDARQCFIAARGR